MERRHEIGVPTIGFGRDYPHSEGTWPNTLEWLRDAFAGVPEDEVRRMTSINAARVYGFDLDALQKIADRVGPTVEELATPVAPEELPAKSFSFTVGEAVDAQRRKVA